MFSVSRFKSVHGFCYERHIISLGERVQAGIIMNPCRAEMSPST